MSLIKIATWNLNSINARLPLLLEWIEENNPDVILLQELKCEDSKFPYEAFEHMNYKIFVKGQKSYNGVAILSKIYMEEQSDNFPENNLPEEARFLECMVILHNKPTRIICLYAPNGGDVGSDKFNAKLKFFDRLYHYLEEIKNHDELLILGGDLNIAKEEEDVYDPQSMQYCTCFTLEERQKLRSIINLPMLDTHTILNKDKQIFTWWDYRKKLDLSRGIRIDYVLSSPNCIQYLHSLDIQQKWRERSRPSDHAPCILSLNFLE